MNAPAPPDICKSALWDHINGWEVVAAVLLIVTAYALVQLGRMYFMWRTAAINNHCNCKGGDDERAG